jgi:hypothetical protein
MKRRAASHQQAAGVSLFPFLAVLLCTMGALIVVLVVIARHAHLQVAEAARRATAAAADSELTAKRGELEWRISELTSSRDGTQKLLADKQLELSHLEEHARRLKDQLDEAAAAREHFSELAAGDARENDELKNRLSRLNFEAERTKTEIDKLRGKSGNRGDSYAIIPYRGPSETRRRPIYIECRKDAVLLQPEGIALTEHDFTVDLGPSNPLVSALRAASEHHRRNQFAGKGEAGTPYPLFIVRPDGIMMWYAARAAITSWGSEFGYELVGQDWSVEFPPPDPMLTLAMRQAVSEGRLRQAYLARAAPRLSNSGSHATFRASPHGGLVQVEGSPPGGLGGRHGQGRPRGILGRRAGGGLGGGRSSGGGLSPGLVGASEPGSGEGPVHSIDGGDNPYLSAQTSRAAPGGGTQGTPPGDDSRRGGRYASGGGGDVLGGSQVAQGSGSWAGLLGIPGAGDGRYGSRGAQSGQNGLPGGANGASRLPPSNLLATASGGTGQGIAPGSGSPFASNLGTAKTSGKGMGGGGTGAGNQSAGGNQTGGGNRLPGGSPNAGAPDSTSAKQPMELGSGINGQPGGEASGNRYAQGGGSTIPPTGVNPLKGTPSSGQAGAGTSELTDANASGTSSGGPNVAASPNGIAGATVVDNGDPGNEAKGGSTRSGSAGGQSDSGSRASSNAAQSAKLGGGTGSSSTPSRGSPNGQQTASGSSSSSGASSSASSSQSSSSAGGPGSAMQPGQPTVSMPNLNLGQQNPQSMPESVAKQRGERNWANPDAGTTNVPIQRAIRVVCDADHLTLMPEGRGRQSMRVIQLKPRTADSVDDLVTSVWDRIDSWATAGRGMYWRPTLLMEVEPGGQRRYAELQSLLTDSGFDVHGKPRTRTFGDPRRVGQARPANAGRPRN